MLKGFVSGEEKDIKRIPMKGKNLAPPFSDFISGYVDINGNIHNASGTLQEKSSEYIQIDPDTDYVFTFQNGEFPDGENGPWRSVGIYDENKTFIKRVTGIQTVGSLFFNSGANSKFVRLSYRSYGSKLNTMLNLGSTALPYEPYGYQEGWEVRDNEDRILWGREDELQTATGTLPFKGYSLPLKVKSLLGNAVQNGTPAPDNIITPEMCGVRTGNLFDKNNSALAFEGYNLAIANTFSKGGTGIVLRVPCEALATYTISGYVDTTLFRVAECNTDTIPDQNPVSVSDMIKTTTPQTYTLTTHADTKYILIQVSALAMPDYINVLMLNLGSTALPYEPYGWKVPFENHGENLFDASTAAFGKYIDASGVERTSSTGENNHSDYIPVKSDMQYTLSETKPSYNSIVSAIAWYTSSKVFIQRDSATLPSLAGRVSNTWTAPSNAAYAIINFYRYPSPYSVGENDMLNEGSSPKPYSPYLNETLPVYLGEVPTVRRVKKLVLTGEETIYGDPSYDRFIIAIPDSLIIGVRLTPAVSSHYSVISDGRSIGDVPNNSIYSDSNNPNHRWFIKTTDYIDVTAFKSYLASEYSAGTPVTIWYVLANEQTTISNEPLSKIGTYADELTTIQVHGLSAPLYGIGDYKDTLNLATGVVTRKVGKLVLTGGEAWNQDSVDDNRTVCNLSLTGVAGNYGYCSHIEWKSPYQTTEYDRVVWNNAGGGRLYISLSNGYLSSQTVNAFKSYLAAQYANGTPVTIWYVLAEPTTETVTVPTGMTGEIEGYLTQVSTPTPTNRSVPKWNGVEETGGTYAVTVYTPPEIPTTTGENTLTVETEKIHGLTNPLCGIGDYKDVLNLSTGVITRKVKKLVLDGTEEWQFYSDSAGDYGAWQFYVNNVTNGLPTSSAWSNIADYGVTATTRGRYQYGVYLVTSGTGVAFQMAGAKDVFTGITAWKSYLAAQYANGTPVIIWYVLSTPETETITVPYGLECSVEGYLTQSDTPTPSSPITPDSNGILESDGTYAVEVSLVPSNLTVKGHIKELT